MPIEQLIVLALVQGLTEFLPISSSGHLNLVHALSDWSDQGALIDVAVHVGSLFAVLIYFRRDVRALACGGLRLLAARFDAEARLFAWLALATLPVLAGGAFLMSKGLVEPLRTAEVVAWANMIFALVLYAVDRTGALARRLEDTSFWDALAVGFAQVLALIPGVSRAGITITMARHLGYERTEAARFSMLLSIPTILALGLAGGVELAAEGRAAAWSDAAIAAVLSLVAALLSISVMMALLRRMSLTPFVAYRVILGIVLLYWIYGPGGG